MRRINEIAQKVYLIETPLPGLTTRFSVFVVRSDGSALLEPGPASAVPLIQEALDRLGVKKLKYVIPTHIHVDHAGASGTLARLFPEAQVLVHPAGRKHMLDPTRLIQSTRTVFGDDFESHFGPILPVPEARIKVAADGQILDIGGRELQVYYAPGHAPHHMAVLDKSTQGLFCGEALGVPVPPNEFFPLPAVAPPSFDQQLYLETMEKLRSLHPRLLFYSHGGVGSDPDRLIRVAEENTRAIGEIILEGLKAGRLAEEIGRELAGYISLNFGVELEQDDLMMTVGGYSLYFTTKGKV